MDVPPYAKSFLNRSRWEHHCALVNGERSGSNATWQVGGGLAAEGYLGLETYANGLKSIRVNSVLRLLLLQFVMMIVNLQK